MTSRQHLWPLLILVLSVEMVPAPARAQTHAPTASPPSSPATTTSAAAPTSSSAPKTPPHQEVPSDTLALGQPVATASRANKPVLAPEVALKSPAAVTVPPPVEVSPGTLQKWPKKVRYRGETEMPGYVLQEGNRTWMWVTGAAMIGVPYVLGIATASESDFSNKSGFLVIPVVGPWVTLAAREKDACSGLLCASDTIDKVLIVSGVVQAIGAAMIAAGFSLTYRVWIRDDLVLHMAAQQFAGDAYGAALGGTF